MAEGNMGRIVAGAGLMALGYAASRLLGLIREIAIAWRFGATGLTDIYNAAFLIPDILNSLLAGGAFSIVLVPMLARYVEGEGHSLSDEGSRTYSTIFTPLSVAVVALTAVAVVFARGLSTVLYPEFVSNPGKLETLVRLTRIILPAQVFFVVGGLVNATLRARGDFRGNTWGPNLYNLGIIAGCLLLGSVVGIEGLGVGVVVGAFLGPFALSVLLARGTLRLRPSFNLRSPELREFVRLNLPLMAGVSLLAADEWFVRFFGAKSWVPEGTITCLKYGRTLMLVPVALIGQTAAQASLTFLSQLYQRGELAEFSSTLGRTMRGVVFLSFVLAGGLFAVAHPLTSLLFVRGAFTVDNARTTAELLQRMVWSVPAFATLQVLVNGYYARKNTLRPMLLSTVLAGVSLLVYDRFCALWSGHGIALATTTCFWLMLGLVFLDYVFAYGRSEGLQGWLLALSALKGLVVSVAAAAAASVVSGLLPLPAAGLWPAVVTVAVAGVSYGVGVLGALRLAGGEEGEALRRLVVATLRRCGGWVGRA